MTVIAERKMPKSYLTDEEIEKYENDDERFYLTQSKAADKAGDNETGWEWLAFVQLPAHTLSFFKRTFGADFIRKYAFDTTEADKVYGERWLEK